MSGGSITKNLEVIQSVVQAPVVSHDSNSPEALMARDAKRLQVQASIDSKYDTVLTRTGDRVPSDIDTMEGFSESFLYKKVSLQLLFLSLGLGFIIFYGLKKHRR